METVYHEMAEGIIVDLELDTNTDTETLLEHANNFSKNRPHYSQLIKMRLPKKYNVVVDIIRTRIRLAIHCLFWNVLKGGESV